MTGRSVIPPSGDLSAELDRSERWRWRRAAVLSTLAFDFALVWLFLGWLQ